MSRDPVYAAYLARHEAQQRAEAIMANCKHWGHAEGDWKMSCCACSGMPGGCDNCSDLLMEEMGLA